MKMRWQLVLATVVAGVLAAANAPAAPIVSDTWRDGLRTDPVQPSYAENNGVVGTDSDSDLDLESLWYTSPTAAMAATAGHLTMTQQSGSSSYTTYFTPEATPVTLAQGQKLIVTWVFSPSGLGTDQGLGLRSAIANTGAGERRTNDGSPIDSAYTGYRVSMNVNSGTLPAGAIALRERGTPAVVGNLLVNDGQWTGSIASGGTTGAPAMVNGTVYTYVFSAKRTLLDELEITASVSGGSLNTTGTLGLSYLDTSPNGGSFTFDTFALRPSSLAATATTLDTTLFQVEVVPEPTSFALAGLAGIAGLGLRRRR